MLKITTYSEPGNQHRDLPQGCLVLGPHRFDFDFKRRRRGERAGVTHDPQLREGECE